MSVHSEILEISHALEDQLHRMATPSEAPTVPEVDWARQFAAKVTMVAFNGNIPHDYGATKVTPEELAALLPQFKGALEIVTALCEAGVVYPPPRSLFERIGAALQAPKVG